MDDATLRPPVDNDKTMRPTMPSMGDSDNGDKTLRPTMPSMGDSGNGDRTLRPTVGTMGVQNDQAPDFVLKGRNYRSIKCLSDNSGEAQIYLVRGDDGQHVLKIYYPNVLIDKKLMRIVQNFNFEMMIRVTDFGKTYVDGKNRDYELMEYLEGQTFAEYDLNGDFKQFRRIALQCAAALEYCHQNNIIHKDIKPGNFFFRDKDHTQVVLGDFGISSTMQSGKTVRTTQARTPLYAAPEMYNDVIDGEVEITPAADFYSLGLTLMTLWLGENPLSQNERMMMRKKNEGRLPRINELPERVRMIVQGLTTVNPTSRWGYEQVERWFQGEDVKVDLSSPLLKYRSFVVDPERNLVADNVHELIPLLMENDRLAVSYLYSGRIAEWLDQCGNVKLSTAVKDIVINRYPADQHAGLMRSVYTMDPNYPYEDLRGNKCSDIHSVAISILSYQEEYILALRNPHNNVYLYIETHTKADVDRLRSYFSPESTIQPRVAVLRLVYEIDREMPFLMKHSSETLQDIVHAFGYEDCTEDEWLSLSDGRLQSWMLSHDDKMACEALRILTQGQTPSKSLSYRVLYNVDREVAFDLREADTPYKVGEILNQQLQEWQSLDSDAFAEKIANYSEPDGRFQYFCQLHGWYEQINEAKACFDLKSEENRERLGAYDLRTAAYRFCRILGVIPAYKLDDGIVLKNGADLTDEGKYDVVTLRSKLMSACRHGALSQWMSVFYHEDPQESFAEPYSYERSLEAWVLKLGEIDQNQYFFKRYTNAKKEMASKYEEVMRNYHGAKNKERIWKYIFYGASVLWMLAIIILGVENHQTILENPKMSVLLPVGGFSALILGVRFFFKGYGFVTCALMGLIGLFSAWIPINILEFVEGAAPAFFVPAIVVMTLVYMVICHFTDFSTEKHSDNGLLDGVTDHTNDVKTSLLEPLYYAFKQRSYRFKGSNFAVLDDINNQVHSISGESVMHYVLWSLMAMTLLLELLLFSPKVGNIRVPGDKPSVESVVNQLQEVAGERKQNAADQQTENAADQQKDNVADQQGESTAGENNKDKNQ